MALPDLRAGVYRHYKGKLYLVLGYGRLSDIAEDTAVVVYVGLELDDAHEGPRIQVRSAEGFFTWMDEHQGPRFTYLGPEYQHGR